MNDADYRAMVTSNIKTDSSEVFGNLTTGHATFIIQSFIESAKESISILSGSFNDAFYDGDTLLKALKEAAKRINIQNAIRIITVEKESKRLLDFIQQANKEIGKPVISYISTKYTGTEPLNHFLLVDGKRYRIEEPHGEFDSSKKPDIVKASVCCNDTKSVKPWQDFFDSIWGILLAKIKN